MRHPWSLLAGVALLALAGCFGADDDDGGETTRTVTTTVTPTPTATASPSPPPAAARLEWTQVPWNGTLDGVEVSASGPEESKTFTAPAGALDLYVNFTADGSPVQARVRMPSCDDEVCEAVLEPGDAFHATESLAGNWTVVVEPAELGAVEAGFAVVFAFAVQGSADAATGAAGPGPTGTPTPTPTPTASPAPTPYP